MRPMRGKMHSRKTLANTKHPLIYNLIRNGLVVAELTLMACILRDSYLEISEQKFMAKELIMMTLLRSSVILIAIFVGGHALANDATKVKMLNAKGQEVGEATFTETPNGILLRLTLSPNHPGIAPGTHALHIHQTGKCEPPFKSAGDHFNPLGKTHGFLSESGPHAGDFPNIHVPDKGALTVEFEVPQLSLKQGKNTLRDSDGSALVIHAKRDDYKSDPASEAGDRIACGVIAKSSN
jgi:superoxide dismutase, Cu-Zn family